MKQRKSLSRTPGTIEHFKTSRWSDMRKRSSNLCPPSVKRNKKWWYHTKNIQILMSKDEFYDWCDSQKSKINTLFKKGETPSINRKNPDGHYELSNIEVISLAKNSSLGKKHAKPIIGVHLKTGKIIQLPGCWHKETARLGFDGSSIQKICKKTKNKGYSHKGYAFFYKGDPIPVIPENTKKKMKFYTWQSIIDFSPQV